MTNYFELLGLTPQFDLDTAAFESSYFKIQQLCHPDRFIGKSQIERQAALSRSVDVNDAYQTLKDPLFRAQYLLSLQNIKVGTEHDTIKPSSDLLMEAMDMRENPPAAEALALLIKECIARIANFYKASDMKAMAEETLRLGYLMKAKK